MPVVQEIAKWLMIAVFCAFSLVAVIFAYCVVAPTHWWRPFNRKRKELPESEPKKYRDYQYRDISTPEFDQMIADKYVLAIMGAPWSLIPCIAWFNQMIGDTMRSGRIDLSIHVLMVDVTKDTRHPLKDRFRVRTLPVLVWLNNGVIMCRVDRIIDEQELLELTTEAFYRPTYTLKIAGMNRSGSSYVISHVVTNQTKDLEVTVNHDNSTMTLVSQNLYPPNIEQVSQIIRDFGYEATLMDPEGEQG